MSSQFFTVLGISLVIVRNKKGKWLSVLETGDRGWWLPGGLVDPPESFFSAAVRECQEEAGVDIELKGILRVEYKNSKDNYARLKVIFYAEPIDENQPPKSKPDYESICGAWHSLQDLVELKSQKPGWRGPELYKWASYLEQGGAIYPLNCLSLETDDVRIIKYPGVFSILNDKPNVLSINAPKDSVKKTINSSELFKKFAEALTSNNEKWFYQPSAQETVNQLVDQKGNSCLQYAISQQNWGMAKYCLMLSDKDTLQRCNSENHNVMKHSLCSHNEDFCKLVITKMKAYFESKEIAELIKANGQELMDVIKSSEMLTKLMSSI